MSVIESVTNKVSPGEPNHADQLAGLGYDTILDDAELFEPSEERAAKSSGAIATAIEVEIDTADEADVDWDELERLVAGEISASDGRNKDSAVTAKSTEKEEKLTRVMDRSEIYSYITELKLLGDRASVLTAADEAELSKDIEAGVFAEEALRIVEARRAKRLPELCQSLEDARYAQIPPTRGEKYSEEQFAKFAKAAKEAAGQDADEVMAFVLKRLGTNEEAVVPKENKVRFTESDLQELAERGMEAKRKMIEHNLRLALKQGLKAFNQGGNGNATKMEVVTWANDGLFDAVERFDYTKGYKFSSFAKWRIWKAINLGRAYEISAVALPKHFYEDRYAIYRAERELRTKSSNGANPSIEAIAERAGFTPQRVKAIRALNPNSLYLDTPLRRDKENATYVDLLSMDEDDYVTDPTAFIAVARNMRPLERILHTEIRRLPLDQRLAINIWYGLSGQTPHSLSKAAEVLGIPHYQVQRNAKKGFQTIRKRRPDLADYLS